MNTWKLNDLAARAMGYKELHLPKDGGSNPFVMYSRPGMDNIVTGDWSPSTCADDAQMLINKAVERWGYWSLDKCSGCYEAVTQGGNREFTGEAETPALSLTLCALRAAGIPESEITAAME